MLDDLVVIGYGTIKRQDFTGMVSYIGATELRKIPVSNAAEAITGRLHGVQVTKVAFHFFGMGRTYPYCPKGNKGMSYQLRDERVIIPFILAN